MNTPLKWLFLGIIFILLVLGITYASSMQNITTRTTAEADMLADTVSSGIIRTDLDEQGKGKEETDYVDTREIITNLTANLAMAQKTHPYKIKIDYVFLDDKGRVTTDEVQVKGMQFQVKYINNKGVVKGTAERRLALNQIN